MIGLNEIRDFAMTLPAVEEGPAVKAARRIAAFKVAGKSFLGVESGEAAITVSLGEEQAKAFAAQHPGACEEIRRNREKFMGLRVELSKIPAHRVRELIATSWRHSAPKPIVAAYEKQRSPKT
jgi:hypothetical protein